MNTQDHIRKRIQSKGRGIPFTSKDFLDLGNRASVDQALSRLHKDGTIRRLSRGLYDVPRTHPRFGDLYPSPDAVARALVGPRALLQASGAKAANALGLVMQVPARVVFLTDASNRDVRIGNLAVRVKQVPPAKLVGAGKPTGDVLQALRYLRKPNVDDDVIAHLRSILPDQVRRDVGRDATANRHLLTDWLLAAAQQIAVGA